MTVLCLSLVIVAPFLLVTATGQSRLGVALVPSTARTSVFSLVPVYGTFLLVAYQYVLTRLARKWVVFVPSVVLAVGVGVARSFPAAVFFLPLLVVLWYALSSSRETPASAGKTAPADESAFADGPSPRPGFVGVVAIGGIGLVLLAELVYVVEPALPLREQTLFRLNYLAWLLSMSAAAIMFISLVRSADLDGAISSLRDRTAGGPMSRPAADSGEGGRASWLRSRSTWRRLFELSVVVGVVLLATPYAGLGVASRVQDAERWTLDGLAYAERDHPDEFAAIEWLDARSGQPTVLVAPFLRPGADPSVDRERNYLVEKASLYRWGASPAASLTGLPTVAGWELAVTFHDPEAYYDRVEDVDTIYTGRPAERARLLAAYSVEYVYVGETERERYDVAPFEAVPGVTEVFERGEVVVYRVERQE